MPRQHKRDDFETDAAGYEDSRSFVALDGSQLLYGADWKAQRYRRLILDGYRCQFCKELIDPEYQIWDTDHKIKRSDGGTEDLDNLRSAHRWCHDDRHPEFQPRWTGEE